MSKPVDDIKSSLSQKSRVDGETQLPYVWLDVAERHIELLAHRIYDDIERGISSLPIQVSIEDVDYESMTDFDELPEPEVIKAVRFEDVMTLIKRLKK